MEHPVKIARMAAGLTQAALGVQSGLAESTVCKIELGQRGGVASYRRLGRALGIDYRTLMPEPESK